MGNEHEQMELDTREELEKAVDQVTVEAIARIEDMVCRRKIRTRFEAYGVAAQHQAKINSRNKTIKKKMEGLLCTLEDVDYDAAHSADTVAYEMVKMARDCLLAAAEVKSAAKDLIMEGANLDGEEV